MQESLCIYRKNKQNCTLTFYINPALISPRLCTRDGRGSPLCSWFLSRLFSLCTNFSGLALLNCCILWSTLSFAVKPLSDLPASPEPHPAPSQTTSCSGWVPGNLDVDSPSLLGFLFLLVPSLAWVETWWSAFLGCLGSPGFFRTRFSSFEQRSTKSWSESSMI